MLILYLSFQIKPAEFRLADNVLKLVYGQALLLQVNTVTLKTLHCLGSLDRFGVLFCPLLPGISFICNTLLFYCRAFSVYYFNKPPSTMFRIASTRNFYMALLLITVFLCALPVGYAMVQMHPSADCGPFRRVYYVAPHTSFYLIITGATPKCCKLSLMRYTHGLD